MGNMTREEAKQHLETIKIYAPLDGYTDKAIKALDMAIEDIKTVQKHEETFEWCVDCKEYDTEQHCCHRYNKTIRNVVAEIKEQEPYTMICGEVEISRGGLNAMPQERIDHRIHQALVQELGELALSAAELSTETTQSGAFIRAKATLRIIPYEE